MATVNGRRSLEAGDRLAKYELVELLEADKLASVWVARLEQPGAPAQPVRVQVLDARVGAQLELASAYLAEARAMAKARHRKLLKVLDSGTEGSFAFS